MLSGRAMMYLTHYKISPYIGMSLGTLAVAALTWWRSTRHRAHRTDCAGGENCSSQPE